MLREPLCCVPVYYVYVILFEKFHKKLSLFSKKRNKMFNFVHDYKPLFRARRSEPVSYTILKEVHDLPRSYYGYNCYIVRRTNLKFKFFANSKFFSALSIIVWCIVGTPEYQVIFSNFANSKNLRALNPSKFNSLIYENRIDYSPQIRYGLEVNYKLFNYFQFAQQKYKIRLDGGSGLSPNFK